MKSKKYIELLKKKKNIKELVKEIKSIFINLENETYIPAIIEEGTFTKENGEDFYLKLVLKHQSIKLEKTWLKSNMVFGVEEPYQDRDLNDLNDGAFIYNVLTYRKYKSKNLYQLNPALVSEEINEFEYTNSNYVNAFFNEEYSNLQGLPVIKSTDDVKLVILKNVFNNYLNEPDSNIYPKFDLVAEFEYRTHNDHFGKIKSEVYKTSEAFIKVDKSNDGIYILGSIKITFSKIDKKYKNRKVQVIELVSLKPRKHNPNHFNGDTIEGFVCFKPEVIDILGQHYYIYDLQMFDKNNIDNRYLIDVLEDKIVLWEAEYNKLPNAIKNEIDQFHFLPEIINKNNIISHAMSAMQLEGDWNWDKKLSPEYLLANNIREKAFKRAIDIGISFIEPKNEEDLKIFMIKIESITKINMDRFNSDSAEVKKLINILKGKYSEKVPVDLKLLYLKYCYAIQLEYVK